MYSRGDGDRDKLRQPVRTGCKVHILETVHYQQPYDGGWDERGQLVDEFGMPLAEQQRRERAGDECTERERKYRYKRLDRRHCHSSFLLTAMSTAIIISIAGMTTFPAPNMTSESSVHTRPITPLTRETLSCSRSRNSATYIAVSAKSSPAVLNVMRVPISPPTSVPSTQYE